jgi:hypothetical protein
MSRQPEELAIIKAAVAALFMRMEEHLSTAAALRQAIDTMVAEYGLTDLQATLAAVAAIGDAMPVVEKPAAEKTVAPKPAKAARRPRESKPQFSEDEWLRVEAAILRHTAGGPIRSAHLRRTVFADTGTDGATFERALKAFVAEGRIVRIGERAGTRYSQPATQAKPAVAPAPVKAEPQAPTLAPFVKAGAEDNPEARRAKLAMRLLRDVMTEDKPYHVADIGEAMHLKFGETGYAQLKATLDELVAAGACKSFRDRGELYYQKVPVAFGKPLPAEAAAIEALVAKGGSHTPDDILRELRIADAALTLDRILPTLDALARSNRIQAMTVGTTTRYRQRAA